MDLILKLFEHYNYKQITNTGNKKDEPFSSSFSIYQNIFC